MKKKPIKTLYATLSVVLLLMSACKESNLDISKSLTQNRLFSSTTTANCSQPQRYRDLVFTDAQIKVTTNVTYRTVQDYKATDGVKTPLQYDFYEPIETVQNSTLLRPLIILMHGGGFVEGTRDWMVQYARRFARYGYCAATIDYRLDPKLKDTQNYLTQANVQVLYNELYRAVQDARFAIRFAKKEARSSKIDTNYIFFGGASAGAITALNVAYLDDYEAAPFVDQSALGKLDYGGNQNATAKVRGVFAHSGTLIDLNWIKSGDIPAFNIMGKIDTFFPYDCGIDYYFSRVYSCGANQIATKLTSLNIPNKLILLDDSEINVDSLRSIRPFNHGSVGLDTTYRKRDIDWTADFLYRTFSPNPCIN